MYYFLKQNLDEEASSRLDTLLERVELPPEIRRVPKWWKGDGAASSSIMAAAQLGLAPQETGV